VFIWASFILGGLGLLLRVRAARVVLALAFSVQLLLNCYAVVCLLRLPLPSERMVSPPMVERWGHVFGVVVSGSFWVLFACTYLFTLPLGSEPLRRRSAHTGREPSPWWRRYPLATRFLSLSVIGQAVSLVLLVVAWHETHSSYGRGDHQPFSYIPDAAVLAVSAVLLVGALNVFFEQRDSQRILTFGLFAHSLMWLEGVLVMLWYTVETGDSVPDQLRTQLLRGLFAMGLWSLFPAAHLATARDQCPETPPTAPPVWCHFDGE